MQKAFETVEIHSQNHWQAKKEQESFLAMHYPPSESHNAPMPLRLPTPDLEKIGELAVSLNRV